VSFFDDDDDPPRTPRAPRPSRGRGGARPAGGTTGRPAARPRARPTGTADAQAIRRRQLVAAGVVVLFFIIVIVGVKACSSSAKKSHLRDYNDAVTAIAQKSDDEVSQPLFKLLSGTSSAASGKSVELQNQIAGLKLEADQELKQAEGLDVPDQAQDAQRSLLLALELRRDAMAVIADQLQPALSGTDNGAAARRIAGEMRAFDASDVIWSQRVVPELHSALVDNGIPVGAGGEQIPTSAFLPDLAWLDQTYVADQLGGAASGSTSGGKPKPGTHGHAILSTKAGATTLSTTATTDVPLSPRPVFAVQIQNQGENDETNVRLRVQAGTVTATKTIPTTTAGATTTTSVSLPSTPPPGSQTVKVQVTPVPGEGTTDNNEATYPVQFTK
jgi:hypothetical protein